ncbi:MAG: general secretion pathway protein H [Gammaproteobacteria bacterium]|jgi:general secretion pathway protein H
MCFVGVRKHSNTHGFTLIELMVTLVIIGVIVGMASLSIYQNPAKDMEREAARLQMILRLVADEAILQGAEFALSFPKGAYQFLALNNEDHSWSLMKGKEYAKYTLPEHITLSFEIDGKSVDKEVAKQSQKLQNTNEEQKNHPSLLLLSSGEITPFIITFHHSDVTQISTIRSDGVSGIYLQ